MPPVNGPQSNGRAYWRSLDELSHEAQYPELLADEFLGGTLSSLSSIERRRFLKLMGASLALAGLAGCRRWPEEKIVPYSRRPAGRTPGVPVKYATGMEIGGRGLGLLVTSVDGRPIKIDGNPLHPTSRGGSGPLAQATILDLYDPDRARHGRQGRAEADWDAFSAWLGANIEKISADQGSRLRVLCEATSSPSMASMRQRMQQTFPAMVWHEYESVSDDNERLGTAMAFRSAHRTHLNLSQARVIVSLEADFLDSPISSVECIRDFADSRRLDGADTEMSRLYAFEGMLSLTGANADHRVAVRPADIATVAARLAVGLLREPPPSVRALAARPIDSALSDEDLDKILANVISDLKAHRGRAVVTAGPSQPPEVHLLAHLINDAIGAIGNTVTLTPLPEREGHVKSLASLVGAIENGTVETLLVIGGNPAYDAPADLRFADALRRVPQAIRLSEYDDETASACDWFLPRAHLLEAWGDVRAIDGTITVCQPMIEPLFGGHSAVELLSAFCDEEPRTGDKIVQDTFAEVTGGTFSQAKWRETLHDGVLAHSATTPQPPIVDLSAAERHINRFNQAQAPSGDADIELLFVADSKVYDGRFANNGWQQELPDPLTKLTWDNALLLGIGRAQELRVKTGDVVSVRSGGATVELPALLMPGQHGSCAVVALGYGRRFPGRICTATGVDAGTLRTTNSFFSARDVQITKTGRTYPLAITQDHYAIDVASVAGKSQQDRMGSIFREGSLDEYREHPDFAAHRHHVLHQLSPYPENNLKGAKHRWAMSIDLSACVGCNACVAACHAENNIPIVGKDQVLRGREMHWIRVDRYYAFDKNDGQYDPTQLRSVALQPMPCQMCENAACETVCPVAATMHDADGLNVMVYNRCVGTRYCSNNCPYKVRRFNYFDYWKRKPHREQPGTLLQVEREYYERPQAGAHELRQMQFNPEVSVRMRGVMEKCTFCTQRIQGAKIRSKNQWVQAGGDDQGAPPTIPDGTIQTACEQACPANAITFGDLNDPASQVAQLHNDERSYTVLDELNAKPRVRYLAKVRNTIRSAEPDPSADDHGA